MDDPYNPGQVCEGQLLEEYQGCQGSKQGVQETQKEESGVPLLLSNPLTPIKWFFTSIFTNQ